jgi:hypothetical protein
MSIQVSLACSASPQAYRFASPKIIIDLTSGRCPLCHMGDLAIGWKRGNRGTTVKCKAVDPCAQDALLAYFREVHHLWLDMDTLPGRPEPMTVESFIASTKALNPSERLLAMLLLKDGRRTYNELEAQGVRRKAIRSGLGVLDVLGIFDVEFSNHCRGESNLATVSERWRDVLLPRPGETQKQASKRAKETAYATRNGRQRVLPKR